MKGKRVSWINQISFDHYLYASIDKVEVFSRYTALKMLLEDRIDFFIDYKQEVYKEMVLLSMELSLFEEKNDDIEVRDLINIRLYPAFSDSSRGKILAELYDKEFSRLLYSGELREIYKKWNKEYPF